MTIKRSESKSKLAALHNVKALNCDSCWNQSKIMKCKVNFTQMDTKMSFVRTVETNTGHHTQLQACERCTLWRSTPTLPRHSLLQKCNTVSQYTHERHHAHAKGMAFHQLIFTKLTTTESAYVEIIYTKFNKNSSRNMASMHTKFIYALQ
jgi:hypothetical protein